MAYIGNQPAEQFTSFATQTFSVSATTSYTLDHAVTNENEIALFVNNVRQQPGSGKAYTATGPALTLSAATASTDTMYCVFLGRALQTVTPATNSITTAMISDDAVTAAKIADSVSLGKVLQVVSTTKTDVFTSSSTSFTDITGLSVNITPSSSSSKIMVICSMIIGGQDGSLYVYKLLRGSTDICVGDAASNRARATIFGQHSGSAYIGESTSMTFLDSPSTTSETTYKVQGRSETGSGQRISVNASDNDSDSANIGRCASTITAMEIG